MKVKVLSRTEKSIVPQNKAKTEPKILTASYVRQLNFGISYRIKERENCHAASAELASKARFG